MFNKVLSSFKRGYSNSKDELKETREATKLLWAARRRKLSPQEKDVLLTQSGDLMRLMFLSLLFVIPFGSVLVIVFIKGGNKLGVRFLPSSFVKEKECQN